MPDPTAACEEFLVAYQRSHSETVCECSSSDGVSGSSSGGASGGGGGSSGGASGAGAYDDDNCGGDVSDSGNVGVCVTVACVCVTVA